MKIMNKEVEVLAVKDIQKGDLAILDIASNEEAKIAMQAIAFAHTQGQRVFEYSFFGEFVDKVFFEEFVPLVLQKGSKISQRKAIEKIVRAVEKVNGLTDGQQEAYDAMLSGRNVFLTGGAGSGKSFLLKKFIKEFKELHGNNSVAVTAPTGIAALNVGGITLHRLFKLPIGVLSKAVKVQALEPQIKLVVIDEISMCRADVFETVYRAVKGRAQLICCGDFAQLPPVVTKTDKAVFAKLYKNNLQGLAFLTDAWKDASFKIAHLKEIVRQSDVNLAAALNDIRLGGRNGLRYIAEQKSSDKNNGIVITARKRGTQFSADNINEQKLAEIPGEEHQYFGHISGDVKESDMIVNRTMSFKVGARVVCMANDSDMGIVNGQLGTVTALKHNAVEVLLDGETSSVEVGYHSWEIQGMVAGSIQTVGEYEQIPLNLGWAITIHKSQGQTYSNGMVYAKEIWECGQLYVALSRFTDITKVYVDTLPAPKAMQSVVNFYNGKPNIAPVKKDLSNKSFGSGFAARVSNADAAAF